MKVILLICAVCLGFPAMASAGFETSYDPADWPRHVMKFPADGTLKEVFDSGVRPYRYPTLETASLGFKHVRLAIELKSGERLPEIEVDWGGITPLAGGLLDHIELTSPPLSVEQAAETMSHFLSKGTRTRESLRKFILAAAEDPVDFDDPYRGQPDKFSITWKDGSGPAYTAYFKKTFSKEKPLSIALLVSFYPVRTPLQLNSFYDVPIPPPPGYENVSMDAPRNFGPDSAVEIARSKGQPVSRDRPPGEYEKQWLEKNKSAGHPRPQAPAPAPHGDQETPSFRWIPIALFLLSAIVVIRLKILPKQTN